MTCLKTLPFLDGAKLLIIDEGLDAMHARHLIAGWLKPWIDKDKKSIIELFSFFDPKSWYTNEPWPFSSSNVNIHDFCTVDINVSERRDFDILKEILQTDRTKSVVILDCLSSLIIYVGLAKALWFMERLSKQVRQLICIYRRDIVQSKPPRISALGTTYVKLLELSNSYRKDSFTYKAEIIHRKIGGSIIKQSEIVEQSTLSYEIESQKVEARKERIDQVSDNAQEKIQSSFRIEMSASEMKQREDTVLPYTINSNANTSQIFYQPDDVDDIDEEDPDDDLCI